MKRNRLDAEQSLDPITKKVVELAGALEERSRMSQELLIALATAVDPNEKAQRRSRNAVLATLSKLEDCVRVGQLRDGVVERAEGRTRHWAGWHVRMEGRLQARDCSAGTGAAQAAG